MMAQYTIMGIHQEIIWTSGRDEARSISDAWAVCHVDAAWAGEVEAAGNLAGALSNDLRGVMACLMWRSKVARPAFSEFLAMAWRHDHEHVIAAAGARRTLSAMFKYAAFTLPSDIPESVTLYRGACGLSARDVAAGHSWTTSFDVAAWFAMRHASDKRDPIVLGATVSRGDIAFFTDERSEQECLLLKQPAGAKVLGDPDCWRNAAGRFQGKLSHFRLQALGDLNAA